MNISGILVHVQPDHIEKISQKLTAMDGVEVHMRSEKGQIVVTAEEPGREPRGEIFMAISSLDGVMSATLTYHQVFEEEDL